MTSIPTRVRLLGIRPCESGSTAIRSEWLAEAVDTLSAEAFRVFVYLASIAAEPGCQLDPSPEVVARHFAFRLRNVRRAYHELQERGVLRVVGDTYELVDQWGYFA